ncbi:MAG: hypothetical protein WDN24_15220 [Sphingomonas sp.]
MRRDGHLRRDPRESAARDARGEREQGWRAADALCRQAERAFDASRRALARARDELLLEAAVERAAFVRSRR